MDDNRITLVLRWHKKNIQQDLDIPLDISANKLIVSLNETFGLGMNTGDLSRCSLKTENPIALLRGNKLLSDYCLRNGTIINYTD